MAARVTCPTCGKSVEWTAANEHRPFCSERCRTIDLGAWAAERYRVPLAEDNDEVDSAGDERGGPSPR